MTGESLINGSYDVIGKRVAQGAASGINSAFTPGIPELLAAILALFILAGVYKWATGSYRK